MQQLLQLLDTCTVVNKRKKLNNILTSLNNMHTHTHKKKKMSETKTTVEKKKNTQDKRQRVQSKIFSLRLTHREGEKPGTPKKKVQSILIVVFRFFFLFCLFYTNDVIPSSLFHDSLFQYMKKYVFRYDGAHGYKKSMEISEKV